MVSAIRRYFNFAASRIHYFVCLKFSRSRKARKNVGSFSQVFDGGTSFLDQPAPVPTPNADSDQTPQQNSAYLKDQQELAEIKDSVDNFIAVNEMEDQFATEMTDEGLLVTIRDSILFDPGQAIVKPEYVPIAKELSTMLVSDPARNIVITGHTDNVPAGPNFSSNFELSVLRATNF